MINDLSLSSFKISDKELLCKYDSNLENLRKYLSHKFGFQVATENAIYYAKFLQEDRFVLNLLIDVLSVANDLDKNTKFLQELNNFIISQEVSLLQKAN
jgi:hypothetical protein